MTAALQRIIEAAWEERDGITTSPEFLLTLREIRARFPSL